MAASIKDALQLETDVVEGARGEFSVWVDDVCVARKDQGGFPDDRNVVSAVRRAVEVR